MTLAGSAALVGGFVWTERRLFEVLGASVAMVDDPSAKAVVDRHSAHAAWRSEQWWSRLPVLTAVERSSLVVAPNPGVAAVYDLLAATTRVPGRLAGLYRVAAPRLAVAYRQAWVTTTPVADGPLRRTLGQVETDLEADRAEGEEHVQGLLVSAHAVDDAASTVAGLEGLLLVP